MENINKMLNKLNFDEFTPSTITIMAHRKMGVFDIDTIFKTTKLREIYIAIPKVRGRRQKRSPSIIPDFNETDTNQNWSVISEQVLTLGFIEKNLYNLDLEKISKYQVEYGILGKKELLKYRDVIHFNKVVESERGRELVKEINESKTGDIIFIKSNKGRRGTHPDPNKQNVASFRNTVTIIMFIFDKFINLKVYSTGKIQCTGCPSFEYATTAVRILIDSLGIDDISLYFVIDMINIRFELGCEIDREEINTSINMFEDEIAHSFYEPTKYSGVNIKYKSSGNDADVMLYTKKGEWCLQKLTYSDFTDVFIQKKCTDCGKFCKQCNTIHTFLVFHSGIVIMSSSKRTKYRREIFDRFVNFIKTNSQTIVRN